MGLGFVGARGAQGGQDALEQIIAQRKIEEMMKREEEQRQFENAMQTRQADTSDSRFDRTQGFTEETGRAGMDLNQKRFGLEEGRFGLEQERAGWEKDDRGTRQTFFNDVDQDPSLTPIQRRMVRGLRSGVTLPDLRSPAQRGTDAGVEESSAWTGGIKGVTQDRVDMGTQSGIAQSNAAAANRGAAGGRSLLSSQTAALDEMRSALDDVNVLEQELGETGAESALGAAVPNFVTSLTGWGTDAKQRQATIDRVRQVIGKALEGGVLRKEDEIKYAKILPLIGDATDVAATKIKNLRNAIAMKYQRSLEAYEDAGHDVSRFRARQAATATGGLATEPPPDQSGEWRWNGSEWVKR